MTTYSVRCRVNACRHRRVTTRHPDTYIRPPTCACCGSKKGWRIEARAYNRRGLCHCDGPTMIGGRRFPHRPTHPLCDNHPRGHINQALRRGVPPEELPVYDPDADIPFDEPGTPCTTDEAPF